MGGKGRQDLGKVDTPTNKKETRRETLGDKKRQDQGRHLRNLKNALRTPRAVHCLENKKGDNVERRGDKMLRKADTPSNKGKQEGVQWETRGDKTLGKADTPSNKGNQEGVYHWRQGETRPSRRRTHHPTKGIKKGYTITRIISGSVVAMETPLRSKVES